MQSIGIFEALIIDFVITVIKIEAKYHSQG